MNWGDAHHPGLSETNGDYDGRWLFINDMPHSRIARIDLSDFTTKEIFGPIPNVSAARLSVSHAQHRVRVRGVALLDPDPYPTVGEAKNYARDFKGIIAGVKVSTEGHVAGIRDPDASVRLGPVDGKGPSHGWQFFTCYNSEMAYDSLEIRPRRTRWTIWPPSTGARRPADVGQAA